MAESAPDTGRANAPQNPKAEKKNINKGSLEDGSVPVLRARPTSLALTRSLSKSDSDLLASPLGEEDGGLAGRCGSVSNCRSGQSSKARMPSFASEWDEVIVALWGRETSAGVRRKTSFQVEGVNVLKCVYMCVLTLASY